MCPIARTRAQSEFTNLLRRTTKLVETMRNSQHFAANTSHVRKINIAALLVYTHIHSLYGTSSRLELEWFVTGVRVMGDFCNVFGCCVRVRDFSQCVLLVIRCGRTWSQTQLNCLLTYCHKDLSENALVRYALQTDRLI